MKRITSNALVGIGCLLTFIPSLVSRLLRYLVHPSGEGRGHHGETSHGIARMTG